MREEISYKISQKVNVVYHTQAKTWREKIIIFDSFKSNFKAK